MADLVKPQELGGGEGSTLPTTPSTASSVETKSDETVVTDNKEVTTSLPDVANIDKLLPEVTASESAISLPEVTKVEPVTSVPEVTKSEVAPVPNTASLPEIKSEVEQEKKPIVEQSNGDAKEDDDWQKRETELLKKIEELEKVKNLRTEDGLRLELKVREEEIDLLKARIRNLETELQAAMSKPSGKNHEMIQNIKQQHEELLSKARGMIFDKTKMVKNQELQIEALTTQVQSLKDINMITKDLLEIRNSEVKAMEERFQAMDARFKAEKERYTLVLQRAQTSTNINDDLRKEYETQLAIFKELRERYEQRVRALVEENNRLKASVQAGDSVPGGSVPGGSG